MHAMSDRQIAEARGPLANGRWSLPVAHTRTDAEATNDAMVLAAPTPEDEPCGCIWPCDSCLLREIGNG